MRRRFAFASLIIPRLVQLALGVSIALSFFTQTLAQNDPQNPDRTARPTVTASQSQDLVRFTAPGNVTHMRLEVFSSLGVRVLDTEIKGGNVLDWVLQDKDGQRLGSGAYLCVVTVKSLSGKLSQRFGLVSIDEKQVTLQPVESAQLATAQQHARFVNTGSYRFVRLGGAVSNVLKIRWEKFREVRTPLRHQSNQVREPCRTVLDENLADDFWTIQSVK